MSDPTSARPLVRARRILRVLIWILAVFVALGLVRGYFAFRDRNPGYVLKLDLSAEKSRLEPRPLQAGFGRVKINPDLSNPKRPVWLAGFSQHRAATTLHDDLWAIACVVDDGWRRVGIVALDTIGFFHDDVAQRAQSTPR